MRLSLIIQEGSQRARLEEKKKKRGLTMTMKNDFKGSHLAKDKKKKRE
jgi:hypothetical protein